MSKIKHISAIFIALGLLTLVLVILDEAQKIVAEERKKDQIVSGKSVKPVTVIHVSPDSSHAVVRAFGEVKPHWKTVLKARKGGEILTLSDHLEEGKTVNKGQVLFTFDNSRYQTLLAEAHNQIAQAELLLKTEKQQAKLARNDWKLARSRGNPSNYALRVPQIKAATTQLNLAKASLKEIRKTAGYSRIVAPYNGIVISRLVNLGEVVEPGQELAEIMSLDELDITLKLDEKQWGMLDKNWRGKTVNVYAANGVITENGAGAKHSKWSAVIERDGGRVDSKTRQRSLHLKINSSQMPLAGTFVGVEIPGKQISNLLKIPQSALTQRGDVWFVDSENKLQRFAAESLFSIEENVFVKASAVTGEDPYAIAVSPLSSFFPGLEVAPREALVKLPNQTPKKARQGQGQKNDKRQRKNKSQKVRATQISDISHKSYLATEGSHYALLD